MIDPATKSTLESEGELIIDIRLREPAQIPIDVIYITVDLTAEAAKDYLASHGILTIRPGAVAVKLAVPLIDDDDIEPDETCQLLLSAESDEAKPNSQIVMARIIDNDHVHRQDPPAGLSELDRKSSNSIDLGSR